MFIKNLELINFRNYETLSMNFTTGINILYGDNAQGKTNILEAIYVGSTTKSQRGMKEKDLIRFEANEAHLCLQAEKRKHELRIDMHLKKNKPKGVAIDRIPVRKSSEIYGLINIISFSPEDLSMIKQGPGERRKFLDMELCQLDKIYLHHLMHYNKILNHRNILLKQIAMKPNLEDTLDIWDEQLVEHGKYIICARRAFIFELDKISYPIHSNLSLEKERLKIFYVPNVEENYFYEQLKITRKKDLQYKITNYGPHRDDILFQINKQNLRIFGSQGQQRTTALSLKLAEIELMRKKIEDTPILLLDDVLSELDRGRQLNLLNHITDIQTIVTCTGLEDLIYHRIEIDKIFYIKDGVASVKK